MASKKKPEEIEADEQDLQEAEALKKAAGTSITVAPVKTEKHALPVVKHKGDEYRFNVPSFILPGKGPVLAADAATDMAIVAEILDIEGQGILRKHVKP